MTAARLENTNRSTTHELSPQPDCADRGRQAFIFHCKRELGRFSASELRRLAVGRSGSENPSLDETADAFEHSQAFAAWSAMNVGSQRCMWTALGDMLERQLPALEQTAAGIADRQALGSLDLETDFEMPAYLESVAYHGQPGGYVHTRDADDIRAGLLQEAGGTLYTRGAGSGKLDSKAQATVRYLRERFPGLQPKRILDLGCGHAAQTCGYALAWPDAETHGIDAGEAQLRFAHLRAESLGVPLKLSRRDASRSGFPDGYFDLIVSNILLHEIPTAAMQRVMQECHRLLAPDGVCIHQDVPTQNPDMPGWQKYLSLWQTQHNDEPFWRDFAESSVPDALAAAGFATDYIFESYVPQLDGPLTWYFCGSVKR